MKKCKDERKKARRNKEMMQQYADISQFLAAEDARKAARKAERAARGQEMRAAARRRYDGIED